MSEYIFTEDHAEAKQAVDSLGTSVSTSIVRSHGDKEDDDNFVAVAWRVLLAGLVLMVGGGFTALMYQEMPDPTIKTQPQSSESLVSLVVDGQRHQTKDGKSVVCGPVETPPECRTDLLEQ